MVALPIENDRPGSVVEECTHVRIKDPVNFTPFNSDRKRIKRVVRLPAETRS